MTEDRLPATFNYDASSDFEDMEQDDLLTPRLAVAQALTPQVQEGLVNNGDIFVKTTGEVLIPRGQRRTVIALAWWKEYIEWNPDRSDKKNRILGKSTDSTSELARLCAQRATVINSDGKKVARVQNTYNVMLIVPELSWTDMYLMAFARTHYKVWKRMLNLAKSLKHDPDGAGKRACPLFGAAYELSTFLDGDDTNKWMVPQFGPPEFLGLDHLKELQPAVEFLKANIKQFKEANSSVDDVADDETAHDSNLDESAMGSI